MSFQRVLGGQRPGFVFAGGTGLSYEDLQAKRRAANQHAQRTDQGGFTGLANGIVAGVLRGQARRGEKTGRANFASAFQKLLANKLSGGDMADLYGNGFANQAQRAMIHKRIDQLPHYRRGTNFHPGGMAVVGEDGPEVVKLPRGAQVQPNPITMAQQGVFSVQDGYTEPPEPDDYMRQEMGDRDYQMYQNMNRQQRLDYLNNPSNGFVPPAPEGYQQFDPFWDRQSRFDDANAVRVADAGNVMTDAAPQGMTGIAPSGVGEESQLNSAARSFQGFMKSLADYERTFNDGGATMWPGKRHDELGIAHRDLQMQMKELYNLGVLNGPDLDLMNQILIDPTSVSGNIMDVFGGDKDMETRIPANIAQVRRLMMNRTTPALQQLGIDPQTLMPNDEDDAAFLKRLGLE